MVRVWTQRLGFFSGTQKLMLQKVAGVTGEDKLVHCIKIKPFD